jgi:hypothetical protein
MLCGCDVATPKATAAATLGYTGDAAKWTGLAVKGAASYERLYFVNGRFQDIECGFGATAT